MTNKVDINNELYIPVLKSLDMYVKENDVIHRNFLGSDTVVTVAKRTLVLPTPAVVGNLDSSKFVAFHPLSENVARGDSEIQNALKGQVTLRVTISLMMIMNALIEIAARKELHDELLSSELPIVALLPKADHKTIKNFSDAMSAVDITDVKLFNVYNKRNGTINDRNYIRTSIVSFPLMEEILNPSKSAVWGKSDFRKADIRDFEKLFTFVLPDWNKKDAYSSGSDSMEAPSFHALMTSYVKIMKQINRVWDDFKHVFARLEKEQVEACKDIMSIRVDLSYEELLHNLNRYHNILPTLDGNVGNVDSRRTDTVDPSPKAYPPSKDTSMNPAIASFDPGNVPSTSSQNNTQPNNPPVQQNQNDAYTAAGYRSVDNYVSPPPPPPPHYGNNGGYLTGQPNHYKSMLPGQVGVDQWNRPVDAYGRVMVDQYGRPLQLPAPPPPQYGNNGGYLTGHSNNGGYLTGGAMSNGAPPGDAIADWNNSTVYDNYQQNNGYPMYGHTNPPPPPQGLPGQVGVDQWNRPVDAYGRVMVDQYGNPIHLPPPPPPHYGNTQPGQHYYADPNYGGYQQPTGAMFRIKGQ